MWKSFFIGLYILQTNVMCLKHKWSTYKYDEIFSCGICLHPLISTFLALLFSFHFDSIKNPFQCHCCKQHCEGMPQSCLPHSSSWREQWGLQWSVWTFLWTWHLLGGWHFWTHFWNRLPCQKKKEKKIILDYGQVFFSCNWLYCFLLFNSFVVYWLFSFPLTEACLHQDRRYCHFLACNNFLPNPSSNPLLPP